MCSRVFWLWQDAASKAPSAEQLHSRVRVLKGCNSSHFGTSWIGKSPAFVRRCRSAPLARSHVTCKAPLLITDHAQVPCLMWHTATYDTELNAQFQHYECAQYSVGWCASKTLSVELKLNYSFVVLILQRISGHMIALLKTSSERPNTGIWYTHSQNMPLTEMVSAISEIG